MEVGDLLSLRFEVELVGKGQNEVQNEQASLDQLVGMAAPVTQVFAVERGVKRAGKQVVQVGVVGALHGSDVPVTERFADEAGHRVPFAGLSKFQKVPLGEVAGMGGHEVEKGGFSL